MVTCGICLDEGLQEIGELSSCAHRFCFPCIVKWSGTENSCPLCKERFIVISRKRIAPEDGHDSDGGSDQGPLKKLRGTVLETLVVEKKCQIYAVEGALTDAALLALRCVICAGGEDDEHLLLCDGCDRGFHTYCVQVEDIPEAEWYCPDCAVQRIILEGLSGQTAAAAVPVAPVQPHRVRPNAPARRRAGGATAAPVAVAGSNTRSASSTLASAASLARRASAIQAHQPPPTAPPGTGTLQWGHRQGRSGPVPGQNQIQPAANSSQQQPTAPGSPVDLRSESSGDGKSDEDEDWTAGTDSQATRNFITELQARSRHHPEQGGGSAAGRGVSAQRGAGGRGRSGGLGADEQSAIDLLMEGLQQDRRRQARGAARLGTVSGRGAADGTGRFLSGPSTVAAVAAASAAASASAEMQLESRSGWSRSLSASLRLHNDQCAVEAVARLLTAQRNGDSLPAGHLSLPFSSPASHDSPAGGSGRNVPGSFAGGSSEGRAPEDMEELFGPELAGGGDGHSGSVQNPSPKKQRQKLPSGQGARVANRMVRTVDPTQFGTNSTRGNAAAPSAGGRLQSGLSIGSSMSPASPTGRLASSRLGLASTGSAPEPLDFFGNHPLPDPVPVPATAKGRAAAALAVMRQQEAAAVAAASKRPPPSSLSNTRASRPVIKHTVVAVNANLSSATVSANWAASRTVKETSHPSSVSQTTTRNLELASKRLASDFGPFGDRSASTYPPPPARHSTQSAPTFNSSQRPPAGAGVTSSSLHCAPTNEQDRHNNLNPDRGGSIDVWASRDVDASKSLSGWEGRDRGLHNLHHSSSSHSIHRKSSYDHDGSRLVEQHNSGSRGDSSFSPPSHSHSHERHIHRHDTKPSTDDHHRERSTVRGRNDEVHHHPKQENSNLISSFSRDDRHNGGNQSTQSLNEPDRHSNHSNGCMEAPSSARPPAGWRPPVESSQEDHSKRHSRWSTLVHNESGTVPTRESSLVDSGSLSQSSPTFPHMLHPVSQREGENLSMRVEHAHDRPQSFSYDQAPQQGQQQQQQEHHPQQQQQQQQQQSQQQHGQLFTRQSIMQQSDTPFLPTSARLSHPSQDDVCPMAHPSQPYLQQPAPSGTFPPQSFTLLNHALPPTFDMPQTWQVSHEQQLNPPQQQTLMGQTIQAQQPPLQQQAVQQQEQPPSQQQLQLQYAQYMLDVQLAQQPPLPMASPFQTILPPLPPSQSLYSTQTSSSYLPVGLPTNGLTSFTHLLPPPSTAPSGVVQYAPNMSTGAHNVSQLYSAAPSSPLGFSPCSSAQEDPLGLSPQQQARLHDRQRIWQLKQLHIQHAQMQAQQGATAHAQEAEQDIPVQQQQQQQQQRKPTHSGNDPDSTLPRPRSEHDRAHQKSQSHKEREQRPHDPNTHGPSSSQKEASKQHQQAASHSKHSSNSKAVHESGKRVREDGRPGHESSKHARDSSKRSRESSRPVTDSNKLAHESGKQLRDSSKHAHDGSRTAHDGSKPARDGTKPPREGGSSSSKRATASTSAAAAAAHSGGVKPKVLSIFDQLKKDVYMHVHMVMKPMRNVQLSAEQFSATARAATKRLAAEIEGGDLSISALQVSDSLVKEAVRESILELGFGKALETKPESA